MEVRIFPKIPKYTISIKASSYKTGLDDVRREIGILKKIDHPNIIKLYEILDDENSSNLFLS